MTTTIPVSKETREMLRPLGEKGESYDQMIKKLLERAAWQKADERWNKMNPSLWMIWFSSEVPSIMYHGRRTSVSKKIAIGSFVLNLSN